MFFTLYEQLKTQPLKEIHKMYETEKQVPKTAWEIEFTLTPAQREQRLLDKIRRAEHYVQQRKQQRQLFQRNLGMSLFEKCVH